MIGRSSFAAIGIATTISGPTHAQPGQWLRVGPTTIVSADEPAVPRVESWLAVSPTDPKQMIAISIAGPKHETRWSEAAYTTADGGSTWRRIVRRRAEGIEERFFRGADPAAIVSPEGTMLIVDLEWGTGGAVIPGDTKSGPDEGIATAIFRSTDNGQTWTDPITFAGMDHPVIAVDRTDGPYAGRIYVGATVAQHTLQGAEYAALAFAVSVDDGQHFDERIFRASDHERRPQIRFGPAITDMSVGPDGTVVLVYALHLGPVPGVADSGQRVVEYWVTMSANGGSSFSEARLIATESFPGGPEAHRRDRQTAYFPRLAIDGSVGVNRGRYYFAYQTFDQGRSRLMVSRSTDRGVTWNEPVRVSPDSSDGEQAVPGLAVSQNGTVGVTWYDRRADPTGECYQEYFAASLDGGLRFLPGQPIRSEPTCPDRPANQTLGGGELDLDPVTSSYRFGAGFVALNGGETQGIVGGPGGSFHLAWITTEGATMALASTPVEVLKPPLGRDVSDQVRVVVSDPLLDSVRHTVSIAVEAVNLARRPLEMPLVVVLTNVAASRCTFRLLDTADWILSARDGRPLAPGGRTGASRAVFQYTCPGADPVPGEYGMDFRVLEASGRPLTRR